jgi:peptidyl-prolyl cis-trans isomerase D
MSVIQQIQEKYAKLMAVIIAVALIIFVVMLAFENGGSLFNNRNNTTVGLVNGKRIDYAEFKLLVDRQEAYMKQNYGGSGEMQSQQAISSSWNQEVDRLLMASQLDKLGMGVGKKELGDLLYGDNPPEDLKRQFTDKETGFYNAQLAKSSIDRMLKTGTAEQVSQISTYIDQLEFNRMNEKYNSLLTNSANYPKWMIEKENADNSQIAKISFVREVYTSIPDSTVKISDKEIETYLNKHKEDYKQAEDRSIAYVTFSALPTSADSSSALQELLSLKPEFDTTTDAAAMVSRYGNTIPFTKEYFPKSQLQAANQQMGSSFKDSILALSKNGVYGPYLDGGNYVIAKMLDIKTLPDSVKCRHILLGTTDPQTGQPIMEDSVAKRKIDSIERAIKGGANFDSLETKYTTDQVAHRDKGVMTFASTQIQGQGFAPEFGQFILFDGKPGDKKVVKTSFGWHYIEILSFIKPEQHYQVAYLAEPIEVSRETDNAANNKATQFAGDSRDLKSFDANAEKLKASGINKLVANNITPEAYQVPGLGISRAFIKSIYDAKLGEVLEPEMVGDNYVVAIVTEVNKKGTQTVAKARPQIEPLLRNHKKAEMLITKIGKAATLEAVATALGGKTIEVADSIRLRTSQGQQQPGNIANEPKVIGAAFNPANKEKISDPIEGSSGVYVIRVENVSATAIADADVEAQRKSKYQEAKMRGIYPQGPLKEAATIKDYRNKFF